MTRPTREQVAADHARLFGRTANPSPAARPAAAGPCRFRGELLTGHQRKALGLSHLAWAPCGHPARPLGDYVCPCRGCRPGCRGYEAPPPDDV